MSADTLGLVSVSFRHHSPKIAERPSRRPDMTSEEPESFTDTCRMAAAMAEEAALRAIIAGQE